MTINQNIILAIDTAFEHGRVVVFTQDGLILSDHSLEHKMSHSTALCGTLETVLRNLNGYSLKLVMTGLGPGSFVGLRISLATALGFAFGRSIPIMGFSSSLALAYSCDKLHDSSSVITKASGNLVYFSGFSKKDSQLYQYSQTLVVDKNEALKHAASSSLVISDQDSGPQSLTLLGPSSSGVVHACLDRVNEFGIIDESETIKPNYIKPPSVSTSKKSPVCVQFEI
ncbi:MAG: tRNA (adenosine(37)-N6)-threonylcarbamoyltransferase complex dimerization subunit type 1 TsaB [Myxococcales bacterium]|nr:MAG: tRNA (adenosine(37)-N6)-threonylcarbamoyltransferase complex dimerization subunit type 1 TsaB [Myxococcales bacterium]